MEYNVDCVSRIENFLASTDHSGLTPGRQRVASVKYPVYLPKVTPEALIYMLKKIFVFK